MAEYERRARRRRIRCAPRSRAQLLQLRPRDLLAQTAVMLANQAAIRLGLASPEHQDREQAREAIDALAGIVELLAPLSPPDEIEALRATSRSCAWPSCSRAGARGRPPEPRRHRRAGRGEARGRRPGRAAPVDLDAGGEV